jgi:hypothetical protein
MDWSINKAETKASEGNTDSYFLFRILKNLVEHKFSVKVFRPTYSPDQEIHWYCRSCRFITVFTKARHLTSHAVSLLISSPTSNNPKRPSSIYLLPSTTSRVGVVVEKLRDIKIFSKFLNACRTRVISTANKATYHYNFCISWSSTHIHNIFVKSILILSLHYAQFQLIF